MSVAAALRALSLASTHLRPDDIPAVVTEHARPLGVDAVTIHLADLEQRQLLAFGPVPPGKQLLPIDDSAPGRAYRNEEAVRGDGVLWLPLMDSSERFGVLGFHMEAPVDGDKVLDCMAYSNLTGEIIANKSVYGDVIERVRRTRYLSLAAEMRWSLLPPLTYTSPRLAISGLVEPAYDIAGDAFDYAVNGNRAHMAIIDAIGHGMEAGRIANLAVGSYRHSRRHDFSLVDTYWAMDQIVAQQFGHERFATAQLASLDTTTGNLSWINAGHPPPVLVRSGQAHDLESRVSLPIGIGRVGDVGPVEASETVLEPGDAVLFFTDGMIEARGPSGEEFGRARLAGLLCQAVAAGRSPAETARILGHSVLDQLAALQDDATLLFVRWAGPPD